MSKWDRVEAGGGDRERRAEGRPPDRASALTRYLVSRRNHLRCSRASTPDFMNVTGPFDHNGPSREACRNLFANIPSLPREEAREEVDR